MSMVEIQKQLKAPRGQFNDFGKYYYRSCEDIVEAVKPILAQLGYHLIMSDEVIAVGNRVYVQATATVFNGDVCLGKSTASAREAETKKGMDDSQITGTASSYARKYALNGLFAIDDTQDADTQAPPQAESKKPASPVSDKPWYNDFDSDKEQMAKMIQEGKRKPAEIVANIKKNFKISKETEAKIMAL
jgi:hypothetical protein